MNAKRLFVLFLLAVTVLCTLTACPAHVDPPPTTCTHTYQNGTCTLCGEADPNYVPPTPDCTHTYEAGVCTQCGGTDPNYVKPVLPVEPTYTQTYPYTDKDGVVHIRYQDTYTFQSEYQKITDIEITSTKTGTDTPDTQLFVQKKDADGKKTVVYADACGSAVFEFRGGRKVKVQVDPSPINLFFVTGQSNAVGGGGFNNTTEKEWADQWNGTYASYFKRSPETMAYFTFGDQYLSIDKEADIALYESAVNKLYGNIDVRSRFNDYTEFVTPTLDWETAYAAKGCAPQLFSQKYTTFSCAGWCAALANEWIEQTGERIWIVNVAQGGMEIQQFLPSEDGSIKNNEYYQAVLTFNLALETLYDEVDAGHFVLNHMAYYWFQGEANSVTSEIKKGEYKGFANRYEVDRGNRYLDAPAYAEAFAKVHAGFMKDVVYDHNGVRRELEYCGIMTLRSQVGNNTNEYTQLQMTGPRLAQYYMGTSTAEQYKNVYVVSNVTEQWVGATTAEADANVKAYFLKQYGSPEAFEEIFGYKMPTTSFEIHPNVHYLMPGHNELGIDCARNTIRILNMIRKSNLYDVDLDVEKEATITLIGADGYTPLEETLVFDKTTKTATVYPQIAPIYLAIKGVELTVTGEAFSVDAYTVKCLDETAKTVEITLTYNGEVYGTYTFEVVFA